MEKDICKILMSTPIFADADEDFLKKTLLHDPIVREYRTGSVISPTIDGKNQLVAVLSGKARVLSALSGNQAVLRDLSAGDIFGVAELFFRDTENTSRVVAISKCRLIFISEDDMKKMLEGDKGVMYAYIRFLGMRVRFLNKRISCFTAGSAERKLALWLDSLVDEKGSDTAECETPISTLANMLDVGRASLYRAIDSLVSDGFIRYDTGVNGSGKGKKIILTDRKNMIEKYGNNK